LSLLLDALKEAEKSRKELKASDEPDSPAENQEIFLDLDIDQLESNNPEPSNLDTDIAEPEPDLPQAKGSHNELSQEKPQEKEFAPHGLASNQATTAPNTSKPLNTGSETTPSPSSRPELGEKLPIESGPKEATGSEATPPTEEKKLPVPATRPKIENRPRIATSVFKNQEPVPSQSEPQQKSRVLILLLILLLVLTGLVGMYFILSVESEPTFPQPRYNTQHESTAQLIETSPSPKEIQAPGSGTPSTINTPSTVEENQVSPDQVSSNNPKPALTNTITPAFERQTATNQAMSDRAAENKSPVSSDRQISSNKSSKASSKSGIQISKRKLSPRSQSSLTAAKQALILGNLESAETAYRRALKESPGNITAMSSLASLLVQQGRVQEAQILFLKTLGKDPENLIAKTGLINIRAADPSNLAAGSELKQLLIEHPKQAHLHASLGNFYAQRSEWPAAQAAYFEAFALDSKSPDYAFNLAISLDQIGKPDIAANYYEKAIELFGKRHSQFGRADAERRLAEIKGLNEPKGLNQLEGTAP